MADTVPTVQARRHAADYDPHYTFGSTEVAGHVDQCESAIQDFLAAPESERRAFVAFVLFRSR